MRLKRLLSAVVCAALTASWLCLAGCEKDKNKSAGIQTETKKPSVNTALSPVELKDYSFPEFLEKIKTPDMLSNLVYSSFDGDEHVKKVEKQPFENYKCIESLDDSYYTFKEKNYMGVVNKHGTVILEADRYSSAKFVSKNLVRLDYSENSGMPSEYLKLEGGYGRLLEKYSFSEDDISFYESLDENSENNLYELSVNNKIIYDKKWESVQKISAEELKTDKSFEAAYKVSSSGQHYIITFDEYYNFRIYEGVYGMIRLKVGNVYGECYILDSDDYSELSKMITSFGDESSVSSPSKDETLDFIQIVFGMSASDQVEVTISADGYCLTDSITHNNQPMNKYFSVLSKETFVDLVNWVNEALSLEYE